MGKEKTAALEQAKKATGVAKGKKTNRGSSSRSGLPLGWIQGDWIRSSLRQEDLDELAESGLIVHKAAWLPEGEPEPQPRPALEQDHEGEDSAEESGDWESPDDDDEDESDESDEEEVANSPPRSERRFKQHQDPAGRHGKAVASSAQPQKRARSSTQELAEKVTKQPKINPSKARKTLPKIKMDVPVASGPASAAIDMDINKVPDDEESDDAATSKATPRDVVVLSNNEEEVPLRERRRRDKGPSGKAPEVQMKVVHEASQVAYNPGAAMQTNVQKSCDLGAQHSTLNKQQINLNLDLELAKKNLKTARDEVAAMGVTLNRVTSLEQMCVVKTINSKLV
nr:uncharacterized protein LOC120975995 [Aegilops tauschii subsp. strangulata]